MMRPLCFRRPPSRSKTPVGSWPLRGPGLRSTGKSPILMGVQGKASQWAAGASIVRPPCFADRPGRSKNPPGSSRLAPPRHPWWLSRGFDAAIPQKRAFSGVVFLCHTGLLFFAEGRGRFFVVGVSPGPPAGAAGRKAESGLRCSARRIPARTAPGSCRCGS